MVEAISKGRIAAAENSEVPHLVSEVVLPRGKPFGHPLSLGLQSAIALWIEEVESEVNLIFKIWVGCAFLAGTEHAEHKQ